MCAAKVRNAKAALPPEAVRALALLEENGHETWCVGGFVRDALLGREGSDLDIATSACWQDVQRIFEGSGYATYETGVAHGTLTVVLDGRVLEITTYRTDGAYSDGRHPDKVLPAKSIEEDLARRDFTVNALAYHPERGLLDVWEGVRDLEVGVIRTVGDPVQRLSEDALRILRGCRFHSQLGFRIEEATFAAMMAGKHLLAQAAAERVRHELEGLLAGPFVHDALMDTVDVLSAVLPELVSMKGFEQHTPYHIYDVLEHTAWAVQHSPHDAEARWAALFHDMGKPAAFFRGEDGVGHFYGHARIGCMLAEGVMRRLRFSSARSSEVLALVTHHDDVVEPTPKAVKRMLAKLNGNAHLFRKLCALKRADALSQAPRCSGRVELANELELILENVLASDEAFSLKKLAVNGRDLLSLGVPAGPRIGALLDDALGAVIEERLPNEREALLEFVRTRAF